jgi:hypothetical protein
MKYKLNKNFNALDRLDKWDEISQEVVQARIKKEKGAEMRFSFLSEREGEILEILTDVLIMQEKNNEYVKIAEMIDQKLAGGFQGVRYGDDPWPQEFYKKGLAEAVEYAQKKFGKPIENLNFQELNIFAQDLLEKEKNSFLHNFLRKVLTDATAIYYSHPSSWNEIGFPGPAYPEGYSNLDCGEKEKWEPKYEPKA